MTADESVDRQLAAVFNSLVTATYVTKQLVWAAPMSSRQPVDDLLAFLVEQSRVVDEAEARLGGRRAEVASPSSHDRRNLLGEVGNDTGAALRVYAERVGGLVADIRRRAADMGEAEEAQLLVFIADGLARRVAELVDGPT